MMKKENRKQAFHISEKERDAIMMERMVNDYKKGTIYGETYWSSF